MRRTGPMMARAPAIVSILLSKSGLKERCSSKEDVHYSWHIGRRRPSFRIRLYAVIQEAVNIQILSGFRFITRFCAGNNIDL